MVVAIRVIQRLHREEYGRRGAGEPCSRSAFEARESSSDGEGQDDITGQHQQYYWSATLLVSNITGQ
jgi:hypothetical protein